MQLETINNESEQLKNNNNGQQSVDEINQVDTGKIELKRTIGVIGGSGLIVGCIIGSGIFITPYFVLERTGSIGFFLVMWTFCGFISMLGGLCFAELGTTIPQAGAEYNYILESFGPVLAFLFIWTSVFIIKPASVTIIAISSAKYIVEPFFPECIIPDTIVKYIAAIIILFITLLNVWSVTWSIRINNGLNWTKFVCIGMFAIIGFINLRKQEAREYFSHPFQDTRLDVGSIGYALFSTLWAYDGFNNLNYAAEEMKNPEKNMPRSIILGMTIVIVSFLTINVCYIAAIGSHGILQSETVGLTIGYRFLGTYSFIVPILVACCTFGSAISTIFGNSRLLFVASRNGHLPMILSSIHRKNRTPVASLSFTALISIIMLIPDISKLDEMINLFSFATWLSFLLCFMGLIRLRYTKPELHRPFKVWIIIPAFMCIVSVVFIILPIFEVKTGFLIALSVILSGLPFYFVFVYYKDKLPAKFFNKLESMSNYIMDVFNLAAPEREEDMG